MMRSWQLLIAAGDAKLEREHAAGLREWADRLRNMAQEESDETPRSVLLNAAADYERIADSLESIRRSRDWIRKPMGFG